MASDLLRAGRPAEGGKDVHVYEEGPAFSFLADTGESASRGRAFHIHELGAADVTTTGHLVKPIIDLSSAAVKSLSLTTFTLSTQWAAECAKHTNTSSGEANGIHPTNAILKTSVSDPGNDRPESTCPLVCSVFTLWKPR